MFWRGNATIAYFKSGKVINLLPISLGSANFVELQVRKS